MVRIILGLTFLAALGIPTILYAPSWFVFLAGLLLAALFSLLVNEYVPAVIETVVGDGPIRAVVGADAAFYSDGWSLLLPHKLTEEDHPPSEVTSADVQSWLRDRGAYDADTSHLQLALESRSRDVVLITGICAHIIRREPLLNGALVTSPSAGENVITALVFDLDTRDPQAKTQEGGVYFGDYYISLSHREAHVFRIAAHVERDAVAWEIDVHYTLRGKNRILRLNNDGEPFRTAPSSGAVERYHWSWWDPPPRLVPAETE